MSKGGKGGRAATSDLLRDYDRADQGQSTQRLGGFGDETEIVNVIIKKNLTEILQRGPKKGTMEGL